MKQLTDEMIATIKSMLKSNDEHDSILANGFLFEHKYSKKDLKNLCKLMNQEDKNFHFKIEDRKISRLYPKYQVFISK